MHLIRIDNAYANTLTCFKYFFTLLKSALNSNSQLSMSCVCPCHGHAHPKTNLNSNHEKQTKCQHHGSHVALKAKTNESTSTSPCSSTSSSAMTNNSHSNNTTRINVLTASSAPARATPNTATSNTSRYKKPKIVIDGAATLPTKRESIRMLIENKAVSENKQKTALEMHLNTMIGTRASTNNLNCLNE